MAVRRAKEKALNPMIDYPPLPPTFESVVMTCASQASHEANLHPLSLWQY